MDYFFPTVVHSPSLTFLMENHARKLKPKLKQKCEEQSLLDFLRSTKLLSDRFLYSYIFIPLICSFYELFLLLLSYYFVLLFYS